MNDRNTEQQNRYLEEVCTCLHRAGFETQPLEDSQMPVYWNGVPLCRITGKGSVFYRREDVNTPLAEDALLRVEDIATQTMEYMTAMETAPQLKASGLEGDYRILADFNGTVLAGMHSKHGVQFVTWDWDYKNFKGLKKENLRDNMTTLELVLNMLAEATTTEISKQKSPGTFSENLAVAREGGEAAGIARKAVEERTGVPVITAKNAAQLNQVVTDLLEGATTSPEKQDKRH